MIRDMLEQRKDLQENLFIRGFFISDKLPERLEEFPFYGNWTVSYTHLTLPTIRLV